MAAAMFDSRPIEIARPLLFESEEDGSAAPSRRAEAQAQVAQEEAQGARRGAAAGRRAGQEEEEEAVAPPPRAEISEYERTRMRNIAAGNKKLYSLGLIHPPPEVVADPEHSWWSERARTRVFLFRA
ncbi:hypothetical protein JL722_10176 [Aureococcus anophagefferens]|nr:hypothetical protein JL722_10176 [Aureococcus anophagefferens]